MTWFCVQWLFVSSQNSWNAGCLARLPISFNPLCIKDIQDLEWYRGFMRAILLTPHTNFVFKMFVFPFFLGCFVFVSVFFLNHQNILCTGNDKHCVSRGLLCSQKTNSFFWLSSSSKMVSKYMKNNVQFKQYGWHTVKWFSF